MVKASRMRVLHILSQLLSKTGSGVFVNNLMESFANKGLEQAIVVGSSPGFEDNALHAEAAAKVYRVDMPRIYGMSDVMPYDTLRFSDMDEEAEKEYIGLFSAEIGKAISEFRPDLVISNHIWLASYAAAAVIEGYPSGGPGRARPLLFVMSHGTDIRQMSLAPRLSAYAERCADMADMIMCLHDEHGNEIAERLGVDPSKIRTVGIACDASVFRPPDPGRSPRQCQEGTTFLYAGKLSYSKGVRELIRAFEAMGIKGCRLLIAGTGEGPERDSIADMAESSDSDISLLGMLSQRELAEVMRRSHVLVLPSYYEGLPLVIQEAIMCGCDIIASDLPGVRSLLGPSSSSEGIELVGLPSMKSVDEPVDGEIDMFVSRLKAAMESAAERFAGGITVCRTSCSDISAFKSWSDISDMMIREYESMSG